MKKFISVALMGSLLVAFLGCESAPDPKKAEEESKKMSESPDYAKQMMGGAAPAAGEKK